MTFEYDSENNRDNEQRKLRPDANGEVAVNVVGEQLQGIIDAVNAISIGGGGSGVEYVEGVNTDPATGKAILIRNALGELVVPSADNPLPVDITDASVVVTAGPIAGTEDGTPTGVVRTFVNNVYQQILATSDRDQEIFYADFGTKNQRVTRIDYTSAIIPSVIARKEITYTLVGIRYRRDKITRSLVI